MDRIFHIGDFTVLYETGFLRYIKCGNKEIVRMMYFALRDHTWETVPFVIVDERIRAGKETFSVAYKAIHFDADKPVFEWLVELTGSSNGNFSLDLKGRARDEFSTNRAGICVLHPLPDLPRQLNMVVHPDGSLAQSSFPACIGAHQVLKDVKELHWRTSQGISASLFFEGDVFETEDHRNWLDASFKTYCTPLSQPSPVRMKPGHQVHQKVLLKVNDTGAAATSAVDNSTVFINLLKGRPRKFPRIGAQFATGELFSELVAKRLEKLRLDHLRVEIRLSTDHWREHLTRAAQQAQRLKVRVMAALFFDQDATQQWHAFAQHVRNIGMEGKFDVLLFDAQLNVSNQRLIDELVPLVRRDFRRAFIGCGSNVYFAEFNRNPLYYEAVDFVCFPATPQVHATDDRTLVENLEAVADMVSTARHLTGKKKIFLSPVTLRPRYNPAAADVPSDPSTFGGSPDPRQQTAFGAAWLMGFLKHISEFSDVHLTLFETHGARGFFGDDVCPVYDCLRRIQDFEPRLVFRSESSDPLRANSWVMKNLSHTLVILFNHTPMTLHCNVDGITHVLEPYETRFSIFLTI